MKYVSRLSDTERTHLAALRGRELVSLSTDGWAAELNTPHGTLRVEPEPMRTPDREHPIAGVVRPRLLALTAPGTSARLLEVARDLGAVRGVALQRTVVGFSPPRKVKRAAVAGVRVPPGIEYRALFRRPGDGAPAAGEDVAVVQLDIAVEIVTAQHRVLLYTDGAGPFISVRLDGRPSPGWEKRPGPVREVETFEVEVGVAS